MYTHKHALCTYIFIGRWAALVTQTSSLTPTVLLPQEQKQNQSATETSLCMIQVLDAERSELVCEILWRNS